ncbi:MAG: hypothetical protein AAF629_04825 [Chloroflexota bacterium]
MILVVAKYIHQNKKDLDRQPSQKLHDDFYVQQTKKLKPQEVYEYTLRHEARDIAAKVFGASTSYQDPDGNVQIVDIDSEWPLQESFTFLDAWKYVEPVEGEDPPSHPYGWIALVTEAQGITLKERIGFPDSHFCKIFRVEFIPPEGGFPSSWGGSTQDWPKLGRRVYKQQTPASWKD